MSVFDAFVFVFVCVSVCVCESESFSFDVPVCVFVCVFVCVSVDAVDAAVMTLADDGERVVCVVGVAVVAVAEALAAV